MRFLGDCPALARLRTLNRSLATRHGSCYPSLMLWASSEDLSWLHSTPLVQRVQRAWYCGFVGSKRGSHATNWVLGSGHWHLLTWPLKVEIIKGIIKTRPLPKLYLTILQILSKHALYRVPAFKSNLYHTMTSYIEFGKHLSIIPTIKSTFVGMCKYTPCMRFLQGFMCA